MRKIRRQKNPHFTYKGFNIQWLHSQQEWYITEGDTTRCIYSSGQPTKERIKSYINMFIGA